MSEEQTNNAIAEATAMIIQKAASGIDAAGQFVAGQVPDVIHQLLMWKFVEKMLASGLFLLIALAALLAIYLVRKNRSVFNQSLYEKDLEEYMKLEAAAYGGGSKEQAAYRSARTPYSHDGKYNRGIGDEGVGICTYASVIVVSGALILSFCHAADAAKIKIAPKVFLIEYAAELVKNYRK